MEATLHGKGIVRSECPACHKPVAHKELLDNHLLQNLVQIVRPWLSEHPGANLPRYTIAKHVLFVEGHP